MASEKELDVLIDIRDATVVSELKYHPCKTQEEKAAIDAFYMAFMDEKYRELMERRQEAGLGLIDFED